MFTRARFLLSSVALAALLCTPSIAVADNLADEAELQFQLGAERYTANDFRGALEHFLASNRLAPNRNVAFNIARAFAALRRFPEAYRYYLEALSGETNESTRRTVEQSMQRIANEVGIVRVETSPPGATIYVDRRDLGARGTTPTSLAFAPGTIRVFAELAGYEPGDSGPIRVPVGQTTPVRIVLRRIVGSIQVTGAPGAVAHLDDENSSAAETFCTVPCTLQAAPGSHTVFVSRPGFVGFSRSIQVAANSETTLNAALQALTSSIIVNASERDALVEVDGRPAGFTPAVVRDVPVGQRTVRISLTGYAPVERTIDVRYGTPSEISDVQLRSAGEVTAASRVAERIEDAPASVSVIEGRELRAFGYPTIHESLRGIRGIFLSNDRLYASVGVRGVSVLGDYGNRLLTLADGHPLNDNILGASYVGYDGRVDLEDVERIEVVRGPGSVLYGTGAFTGVVNLVTRGRQVPTRVTASIGAMGEGVMRAHGGFSINLGRDAGVWASVGVARSGGNDVTVALSRPTDPTNPMSPQAVTNATALNNGNFIAGTFHARAWYKDLTAQIFWSARDTGDTLGAFDTTFNGDQTRLIDARTFAEIRYEPRIGSITRLFLRAHANLYNFRSVYQHATTDDEEYVGAWYGIEARAQIEPSRAFRFTVGGEFQHHPILNMFGASTDVLRRRSEYINSKNSYILGAAYALIEGDPAPWFHYSAGARMDVYTHIQNGVAVNPRAAAIFRPAQSATLKFTGGRAFRAPSIYELYYNDMGTTQRASPSLAPETITSGEVEYSQRFAGEWAAVGAVHGSYLQNIVTSDTDAMGVLFLKNSSNPTYVLGADIELRREWLGGWMFSAMYGYQRTRDAQTGSVLPNVPEHLASVRGVAPIVPGLLQIATRLTLEAPRAMVPPMAGSAFDPNATTPWAVIADVVASGQTDRFGLRYTLGLYNLFDWRYTNPVAPDWSHREVVQPGRTLLLSLGVGI